MARVYQTAVSPTGSGRSRGMNTNTHSAPTPNPSPTIEHRLARLERSNARWRGLAIAGVAGVVGILIGGAGHSRDSDDFEYVATDNTIYRVDERGRFEYIRFEDGFRSPEGYFNWGEIRIDGSRRYSTKPQP